MATKIDPALLEIIQNEARKIAQDVYMAKGTQYNVADVPTHTHNGVDSTTIVPTSVNGFINIPATLGGVVNPDTLGNQIVTQGNTTRGYGVFGTVGQASFPVYPIVVIAGGGNSTSYTLTGGLSAGATSGTLTGNYVGVTGTYATSFDSTEIKNVHYTNGSTAVTWSTPLVFAAGTGISLNGADVFQGGDAPIGTMVIFVADSNLLPQIWIRADITTAVEKWWLVNCDSGIVGFTI